MDFATPSFILEALRQRLDHPILGYTDQPESLTNAFQKWLVHHFDWSIPDEWVVWLPGVVPGLNLATQCLNPGDEILIPTPVYHPFFDLAENAGVTEKRVPAHASSNGKWHIDWDEMQNAVNPNSKMVLISNPQNPTGRCYSHAELGQLAQFVERNGLILVSDEIHANIILDPSSQHTPVARDFAHISNQTISLFAATKTYNIPGLSCAAAVIPDAHLRHKFLGARKGLVPSIGPMGFVASEAAFRDRSDWLAKLIATLRQNYQTIRDRLGTRVAPLEATYLAWIDVGDIIQAKQIDDVEAYFVSHGIGISAGAQFGQANFIRLNFGCPRETLLAGLDRLEKAIPR